MADRSRVLITGVSGFTGRHLATRLVAGGDEVYGLSNSHDGDQPLLAGHLVADLQDKERIADWLATVRPTHVVHLAALSHVVGPALPFYAVNVIGTETLLEAVKEADCPIQRIILASSANIYGQTPISPINEDQEPAPANHYAASKVAMEWVASRWSDALPIIVVRPFNYTGPGQSEAFLFAKLAAAFHRRDAVLRLGNIGIARDLSDISFVVEAYARLLDRPLDQRIFNICSGHSVSIADAVRILSDLTGHSPVIEVDPALVRVNDVADLRGDPSRLQDAIGPLVPVPTEEIFRRMLEAWAHHPL